MEITEIRIKGVPLDTFAKIEASGKDRGEFMCDLLRPRLRKLIESYPAELKIPAKEQETKEIRIPGVSKNLDNQLQTIADNLGVSATQLLRIGLKEIADNLPAIL